MRRGLISRSKVELPDAVLDARLERVRAAMSEAQIDALVVYTNNTRAAGVSWLTGFVPYWSEALLVLPRTRPPVLVVALTYRVKSWIERVSRVAEVIHTPRIGLEAARMIAAGKADAAVGITDRDGLAAGILDDLREGGPRLRLSDATSLFARLRAEADPSEIALAIKAAADRAARARAGGRAARASRTTSPRSKGRRAISAPRRSISPPLPIWRATAACGASKARRLWASFRAARDRCLQGYVDPPRAHARRGGGRGAGGAVSPPRWRSFRASAASPASHPGWSRAAGSRSRSRRSWDRG